MLREQDLMTEDECALILSTMLDLEKLPIEESEHNPAYEDLFFLFEKELVRLAEKLNLFRESLLYLAGENLETVMPMYTHTQPAQPSTLGHYLLSMADVMQRDFQ